MTVAVIGCALSGPAAAPAARAVKNCPARSGTLAKTPLGRVWHHRRSLYGCSTVSLQRPTERLLGPWEPGTHVVFDGVSVAWTAPVTRGGVVSDRVWAASLRAPVNRWMRGARLVPASGPAPARDALVQTILLTGDAVGWVTQTGDVVFALALPEEDPQAVGLVPNVLIPPRKGPLLVGSWPGVPLVPLGKSARLTAAQGEGDECGGTIPYTLTVRPDAALPRVGATWFGGYVSLSC